MKIHSPEWFAAMSGAEPWFAMTARRALEASEGKLECCSVCADEPVKKYKLKGSGEKMPPVYLCLECKEIQANINDNHFEEIK